MISYSSLVALWSNSFLAAVKSFLGYFKVEAPILTRFKVPGVRTCWSQQSRPLSSGLLEQSVERTSDDEPADLAGAGADLVQLCVAQEASGGVVVDVAVPSCGEKTRSERA